MANTDIAITDLPRTTLIANGDLFVVVRDPSGAPTTNTATMSTLRSQIPIANTPANTTALTITAGTMLYDADYLYIAVANNVVKRVALSSF